MNKFSLMPVLLTEYLSSSILPRRPEPDLVMDDPEQVAAYDEAGSIDGLMASAYLFHSARASQVIRGRGTVLDLGCGPAIQLCQIAQLNPEVQFHGIDLSETMLEKAEANVRELGLKNLGFSLGDITALGQIPDASADGVISTMALHHLPTQDHLRRCFAGIARILRPRGALYLVDFTRLKRMKTLMFFVNQVKDAQPPLFNLDYENSLKAAFSRDDFVTAARSALPSHVGIHSTFMVPMLTMIKTEDQPLDAEQKSQLRSILQRLPRRYRSDLDDMRTFFKLGGLPNDPFAGL